jgi:hypothetical protein
LTGATGCRYFARGAEASERPLFRASYSEKAVRQGDWKPFISETGETERPNPAADREEAVNRADREKEHYPPCTKNPMRGTKQCRHAGRKIKNR